jgi:C4-dicarboxylate-specific signal transduction histidine kinase
MLEAEELLLRGRILRNFEIRCLARDGTSKWVSWTAVTVGNESTTYWVGLDITDSKTAQRVIAAQKEQIAASSKMDSLGRLAAGIAHEINNPLTIVYGQTCVLRERIARGGVDVDEAVRGLDNIEKMTKRIVDIISGLRMFARDGSEDTLDFCSLHEIVESTLAPCAGQLWASRIEFIYERPKGDDHVRCRAVQISQVLLNLINNAHDAVLARPTNRRIRVEIVPGATAVEILVFDNGHGVSPQVRANLFQPFFTTKPLGKGTGLGLSIARGIVSEHGGEISFRPGTETCFAIRLPRSTTTGSA